MAANGDVFKLLVTIVIALLALYLLNCLASRREYFRQMEHYGNAVPCDSPDANVDVQLTMPQQCGSSCAYRPATGYQDPCPAQDYVMEAPPTCPQPVMSQCEQDMLYQDPAMKQLRQASCFPKAQLSPEELLPQDNCSLWAQVNPQGAGSLKDRNFLQAGWATGVSTVGSTLRNANRQLRSEPPNPQVKVSPWLQTTIEPDISRKPMEIGGCS